MERKFLLLRDEAKVASLDRRHGQTHKEIRAKASSPSSSFSCSSRDSRCCEKSTECLCSACLLCVCCPLAVVWGCFKLPCKIGWRAAKNARRWAGCGSEMRDFAAYSSFSDNDSDCLPSDNKHTCSKTSAAPKKIVTKRVHDLEFTKPASS
jgi:hypothetical protein